MSQDDLELPAAPPGKVGERLKMLREGFLSVCIFRNIDHGMLFYDTVIYRKVRQPDGTSRWVRGANYKPSDLPVLGRLVRDAEIFLQDLMRL